MAHTEPDLTPALLDLMEHERVIEQGLNAVVAQLTSFGWNVTATNWTEPTSSVEVDVVAIDRDGHEWWIECKGSWQSKGDRNGLKRHDTARKLIASAALLSLVEDRRPYMVITSDLPDEGTVSRWLNMALGQGWIARIEVMRVLL